MLTLLAHGTEYQKEKFLKPLLNGEKRICYSMTEKAAGADATGMQTTAVKDGNENYILNGEKWFSSAASVADMALVMARTDPNAPRHQQFSTFIVELPNPGYKIKRDIPTMAVEGPLPTHHGRRPLRDRDQGPGGAGREPARRRRPRLRHGPAPPGLRPPAPRHAQRRHGPAGAGHGGRARHQRETFGKQLADRQAVQFMLAECASQLYIARLMLLHIAYKAEKGMDMRQENSIAKVYLAHMVHKVVDTAIQLHGALGFSQRYAARRLVHPHPLAAPGRRAGRGAPLDDRPQRHQGVTASTARRRARRVAICCRRRTRCRSGTRVIPAQAGIQYAVASRLYH